jgi:hypothetical protein
MCSLGIQWKFDNGGEREVNTKKRRGERRKDR